MNFKEFAEWAFKGLLSGCLIFGTTQLSTLTTSVQDLNVKMAVIINTSANHEKRLDRDEEQIEQLKAHVRQK